MVQTVVGDDELGKWGIYSRAGFKVLPWLEPALGFDVMRLDGAPEDDRWSIIGGLNFYARLSLLPTAIPRVLYAHFGNDGECVKDDTVMPWLTLGS